MKRTIPRQRFGVCSPVRIAFLRLAGCGTAALSLLVMVLLVLGPSTDARADGRALVDVNSGRAITPIPDLDIVQAAACALDPVANLLYQVGYTGTATEVPRLFIIDIENETLVDIVDLDKDYNNLEVAQGGRLLGFHGVGSALTQLREIDPVTGASAVLAANSDLDFVTPACCAIRRALNAIYLVGYTTGAEDVPLLSVVVPPSASPKQDGAAGEIPASPLRATLDREPANLAINAAGTIYGVFWNGGVAEVRSINPATGVTTLVTTMPDMDLMYPAAAAINDNTNVLLVVGITGTATDPPLLFRVDLNSSTYLGSTPLANLLLNLKVTDEGWLVGISGTEVIVPVFLQAFDSRWAENHVQVAWTVSEPIPGGHFTVSRRSGNGPQVGLAQADIVQDGNEFTLSDFETQPGQDYIYRVTWHGPEEPAVLFETSVTTPLLRFALLPNQPNPFNPETTLRYNLDHRSQVTLRIYNLSGRVVRTLVQEDQLAGTYSVPWDGRDDTGRAVSSGVYFSRLTTEKQTATSKMLLIK